MKKFIKTLIRIALPIALQQLFINLASLIDTVMVGQLDEATISGIYIANQIIFVVNFLIFGSTEGASVFYSQFYGANDEKNMVKTTLFKIYASVLITVISLVGVELFKTQLVGLFTDDALTTSIALSYLDIVMIGMIPYAITTALSTTLRESHHSTTAMIISICGVALNTLLNYLLIFGKLGLPELRGDGAAIGTLAERILELGLIIGICMIKKYGFTKNIFKDLRIDRVLLKNMIIKSLPLILNELFWALGQTMLSYCYTKQNAIATVVLPIVQTLNNLMFIFCIGLANGVTILVGNSIGEGNYSRAQKEAKYSLIFSFIVNGIMGLLTLILAKPIVNMYNGVGVEAKELARILLMYNSFLLLIFSTNCTIFFLLRAGGRTFIVFAFDSLYTWIIQVPFMILLAYTTTLSFESFYLYTKLIDGIKIIFGFILLLSGKWYKNIISNIEKAQ